MNHIEQMIADALKVMQVSRAPKPPGAEMFELYFRAAQTVRLKSVFPDSPANKTAALADLQQVHTGIMDMAFALHDKQINELVDRLDRLEWAGRIPEGKAN